MMAMSKMIEPTESELINLCDVLEKFEREHSLRALNIFEAISMVRQEIRHSRFLAFLLDPSKPHGLGDIFLKKFLREALSGHPADISLLTIALTDFDDCSVYCERDHFDITIEIPKLKILLVIENKIDASEGDEQLNNYKNKANKKYPGYKFVGLFLTPSGYSGDDQDWGNLSYEAVVKCLNDLKDFIPEDSDISILIRHYTQLIERHIVDSAKLIEACKQIYQEHRVAFDFVCQYGQTSAGQLGYAFDDFVKNSSASFNTPIRRDTYIVFYPQKWLTNENYPKATRPKWPSDFPVIMAFDLKGQSLHLRMEVGPFEIDNESRIQFVKALREKLNANLDKKITNTYTRVAAYSETVGEDPDQEKMSSAMTKLWKSTGDWESAVNAVMHERFN